MALPVPGVREMRLGSGCESNICTWRSRPFFGIATLVARAFPGGTPTFLLVGDGEVESLFDTCPSLGGDVVSVRSASVVQKLGVCLRVTVRPTIFRAHN